MSASIANSEGMCRRPNSDRFLGSKKREYYVRRRVRVTNRSPMEDRRPSSPLENYLVRTLAIMCSPTRMFCASQGTIWHHLLFFLDVAVFGRRETRECARCDVRITCASSGDSLLDIGAITLPLAFYMSCGYLGTVTPSGRTMREFTGALFVRGLHRPRASGCGQCTGQRSCNLEAALKLALSHCTPGTNGSVSCSALGCPCGDLVGDERRKQYMNSSPREASRR